MYNVIKQKLKVFVALFCELLRPKKLLHTIMYHLGFYKIIYSKKIAGLHLGSGNIRIPDYINIDVGLGYRTDINAKITSLKFKDNSVNCIYCSHVLEHFPRLEVPNLLKEWSRVLIQGGCLYISVPDIELLYNLYIMQLREPNQSTEIDLINGVIFGGQSNRYNFHFWGYSFKTLKHLLEDAGFNSVKKFTRTPDDLFPKNDASYTAKIMDEYISLNISAVKSN